MRERKGQRKCLTKYEWSEFDKKPKLCVICEEKGLIPHPDRNPLTKDHILPISKGGTNNPDNLRWLCSYHNHARRERTNHVYSVNDESNYRFNRYFTRKTL